MAELVVTHFDEVSWSKHGHAWARSLKTQGLSGTVIDCGLPAAAKEKLAKLGVDVLPLISTLDFPPFDRYFSLVEADLDCGVWLWCQPGFDATQAVRAYFDAARTGKLVCRATGPSAVGALNALAAIENRVRATEMFEREIVAAHGRLLGDEILCGHTGVWETFVAFFRYCLETGHLEKVAGAEVLFLNLFASVYQGYAHVIE